MLRVPVDEASRVLTVDAGGAHRRAERSSRNYAGGYERAGSGSPSGGFEGSFDRAAELDRALRSRVRSTPPDRVTGRDVESQIGRVDRVGAASDELTLLATRLVDGDESVRSELVERSLPLVLRVARRYAGEDVELADLVQEGVLGVLRAATRFDPARGVPFPAYASWWLRQSMQQAIAEQSRSVRLPTHVLWDIHRVREARAGLLAEHERGATAEDLQRQLGWTPQHLDDVLLAERPALSMDAEYRGDEGQIDTLGDLVADPLSDQTYEDVINRCSTEAIRSLLSTLTDRERQVLVWRFGLDGEELSLRQIARRLGVSAERVRQIEQRGLVKLRTVAVPNRG